MASNKSHLSFFSNPSIEPKTILDHEYTSTLNRIKNLKKTKEILLLQDTTHLNYNKHNSKKELNPTQKYVEKGLHLHPTIAITPDKINLGILQANIWTNKSDKQKVTTASSLKQTIEEKESFRWIASIQIAENVAKASKQKSIFNIADRAGDIYELFLRATQNHVNNLHFIIRARYNRYTNPQQSKKLKESIKKADVLGKITFQYKKKGHKHRLITQSVKAQKITLQSPINKPHLPPISLYAILATEQNPVNTASPIEWLLLTNYPVKSLQDAEKILNYYTKRWEIETFFRVLKSGCKIEEIRLETLQRLKISLIVYMVVACKIMFLLNLGRSYPDLACDTVFSEAEWKAVYLAINRTKPPGQPPRLGVIVIGIAQLGGYLNRRNDPPPGPKAMWIGIQKMRFLAEGIELANTAMK